MRNPELDEPKATISPITKPKKEIYRWKPADTTETIENELGVVYLCLQCSAIAYAGNSSKRAWYYSFPSEERRQATIKEFFAGLQAHKDMIAERKIERMKPHTLNVGDILYSSWGYDQTNIDYYQVVSVRGKVVDLRELAQDSKETGFMQGKCTPRRGDFVGNLIKGKRPDNRNTIRISECQRAWPWKGKANHWTSYA